MNLSLQVEVVFVARWNKRPVSPAGHVQLLIQNLQVRQRKKILNYFTPYLRTYTCKLFQSRNLFWRQISFEYYAFILFQNFGILFPKSFWPNLRKNCSWTRTFYSNSKKIRAIFETECFLTCFWRFLISNTYIITIIFHSKWKKKS